MRVHSHATNFWRHVQKSGPNDCWPWIGFRTPLGYGTEMIAHEDTTRVDEHPTIPKGHMLVTVARAVTAPSGA